MSEVSRPTALVTGAGGAIGRRLCARLKEAGWRVIGLSSHQPAGGPWDRYLVADLASQEGEAVGDRLEDEKVSVVWHLAGKAHALTDLRQDPEEYDRINAGGTRTALALARRVGARRFVLASSVKAMGEGGEVVLDETAQCAPTTPYGISKLKAEGLVMAAAPELEPVVLRFCMVYGGADRGNMGRMLEAVRRGRFPPFPETGNRRSFVHVDDAVQACLLAGTEAAAAGEVFVVTGSQSYSTHELFLAMRAVLGIPPPAFTLPLWLFRFVARAGDIIGAGVGKRFPLDSDSLARLTDSAAYCPEKICRVLGYAPRWPLARGLSQMAGERRGEKSAS